MARYQLHYNIVIQDKNGDRAVMRIPALSFGDTNTVATIATNTAALVTALGAPGVITNGKVVETSASILLTQSDPLTAPLPIDAEFPSVADKAHLSFATSVGAKTANSIPAPIEAIFHAPPADDTVDPTSAISAWLTQFGVDASDFNNNSFAIYLGGVRSKQRARRRRTHRS